MFHTRSKSCGILSSALEFPDYAASGLMLVKSAVITVGLAIDTKAMGTVVLDTFFTLTRHVDCFFDSRAIREVELSCEATGVGLEK